jgi:hypothetical protein
VAKIPKIKKGIVDSLSNIFIGPKQNKNWPVEMLTKLIADEQHILAGFLLKVTEQCGEEASLTGLIVYKMIESQMEVDELEEMFSC